MDLTLQRVVKLTHSAGGKTELTTGQYREIRARSQSAWCCCPSWVCHSVESTLAALAQSLYLSHLAIGPIIGKNERHHWRYRHSATATGNMHWIFITEVGLVTEVSNTRSGWAIFVTQAKHCRQDHTTRKYKITGENNVLLLTCNCINTEIFEIKRLFCNTIKNNIVSQDVINLSN